MQLRRWFLSSWFLLICVSALGQSMKLLTPDTGWVLDEAKLFWTTDNGSHWMNITPHVNGYIDDVFFLDKSRGWAMLSSSEDNDMASFRLARTTDSGQSWTGAPFKIPNQEAGELSGTGWLDFVDPEHGWLMLMRNSSSAFSLGRLFGTSDGGTSWHVLDAPVAGRPVFVTAQDGWISGPGWAGMYSTHDGGRNWQGGGPSLDGLPPSLPTRPSYGDVQFIDAKHGFVPVWLQAATDAEEPRGSALALYVTEDGGQTWKRDRTLIDRGAFTKTGAAMSRIGASTVVPDSSESVALLTAFNDRRHLNRVTLMTVASQGEVTTDGAYGLSSENVLWRPGDDIAELSFISATRGWARTSLGDLLLTVDGGATWKDISAIPVARPPLPKPSATNSVPYR